MSDVCANPDCGHPAPCHVNSKGKCWEPLDANFTGRICPCNAFVIGTKSVAHPGMVWTHNDELGTVTDVLAKHTIECTGPGEVTCAGCRDRGWMSWTEYRKHLALALEPLIRQREARAFDAGQESIVKGRTPMCKHLLGTFCHHFKDLNPNPYEDKP